MEYKKKESKILRYINNKLKEFNKDDEPELVELLLYICSNNPNFFILLEQILLDMVKDNELNIDISTYTYFTENIGKISLLYNNINWNDLQPLLKDSNYFSKTLQWSSINIIRYNNDYIKNSEDIINKINELVINYRDIINLFRG